jgi:hypothetical protein
MKKLIILFGISYSLMSCCGLTHDTASEYLRSFINKTDKAFFYVVHTTVGSDSAFSYGNDSIGFYFAIYGRVTLPPIGPYSIDLDEVFPLKEKLYNLTDTCSSKYIYAHNWRDSLYQAYVSYSHEGSFYKHKNTETLVITDTLLSILPDTIMQKDYAMLDKFKAYCVAE